MASPLCITKCAALAMVLVVQASPARSEMIDLSCGNSEVQNSSIRLQIDTDRKTVLLDQESHVATEISAQFIKFERQVLPARVSPKGHDLRPVLSKGTIDRVAGTAFITSESDHGHIFSSSRWACRRATQKF